MRFTYQPEGLDKPKEWAFEPGKLLAPEAIEIEKRTGMRFALWRDEVLSGSMVALKALLYVYLKRETPTLRYDDVVFAQDECDFVMEDDEIAHMVESMREADKRGDLEDMQRSALAALELGLAERGFVWPEPEDEPEDDATPDPTEPADDEGTSAPTT